MHSSGVEILHPVWAEMDLGHLTRNYAEIRRRCGPDVKLIASLKANAYGHGAVEIARALEALGVFAVATGSTAEAVSMRAAGITVPIVMFGSYLPDGVGELLAHNLIPTIYNRRMADVASRAAEGRALVYVKVDAGLGRLGVPIEAAAAFIREIADFPGLAVEGVYTHLPFVDRRGRDWAARRLQAFDGLLGELSDAGLGVPVTQARGSSCLAAGLTDTANAVCVGHLLYGLSPFATNEVGDLSGLRPVLRSLRSRLIHVARHGQGADIAIGGHYGLRHGKTTGVIPLGLVHGLAMPPKDAPACALVGGKRVPLLGVSLEHATLDLDDVPEAALGDEVVVLGADGEQEITPAEMGSWLGRSPLEVMMMFSGRVPHRYVGAVTAAGSAAVGPTAPMLDERRVGVGKRTENGGVA